MEGTNDVGLVDIQSSPDQRNIAIDKVGVRGVRYPIAVLDRETTLQHTHGTFTLTVDLPKEFKGTHMSRFLEILGEHDHEISVHAIPRILDKLRERLTAETAHLSVSFPFFRTKVAPVTGKTGMMDYVCGFEASKGAVDNFVLTALVPIATLCPCSKEISRYGAHNQRGNVAVRIRMKEHLWIEEVIDMIEACASVPLFPVLKRPDEKWVTETAYENPRFVEDVVREVALRFDQDDRITSYAIEVENFESIHAHNAYAFLERTK